MLPPYPHQFLSFASGSKSWKTLQYRLALSVRYLLKFLIFFTIWAYKKDFFGAGLVKKGLYRICPIKKQKGELPLEGDPPFLTQSK